MILISLLLKNEKLNKLAPHTGQSVESRSTETEFAHTLSHNTFEYLQYSQKYTSVQE